MRMEISGIVFDMPWASPICYEDAAKPEEARIFVPEGQRELGSSWGYRGHRTEHAALNIALKHQSSPTGQELAQ